MKKLLLWLLILVLAISIIPVFILSSCEEAGAVTEEEDLEVSISQDGIVDGNIIRSDNKQPISGAAIILCPIIDEGICKIQADLITTSDESGKFNMSNVPSGGYVILYNLNGIESLNLQDIDGVEINYNFGYPRSFGESFTKEFYDTFGDKKDIIFSCEAEITYLDGKIKSINGSLTSKKLGLTMDFYGKEPLTIEVLKEQVTEVEIEALGLYETEEEEEIVDTNSNYNENDYVIIKNTDSSEVKLYDWAFLYRWADYEEAPPEGYMYSADTEKTSEFLFLIRKYSDGAKIKINKSEIAKFEMSWIEDEYLGLVRDSFTIVKTNGERITKESFYISWEERYCLDMSELTKKKYAQEGCHDYLYIIGNEHSGNVIKFPLFYDSSCLYEQSNFSVPEEIIVVSE